MKSKRNGYEPTHLKKDAGSWRLQQIPRPCVSLTYQQYGCIPPKKNNPVQSISLSHSLTLKAWRLSFSYLVSSTHYIPRLPDDLCPGVFSFIFVPTHHVDRATWKQDTSVHYIHKSIQFSVEKAYQWLSISFACTFLCYSHGSCFADATVGSRDHEGPPHNRYLQVPGLKVFRCCFISSPDGKGKWKMENAREPKQFRIVEVDTSIDIWE